MLTGRNMLIDFIGIGAPKSGSTWLGKVLTEHPQILFSSQKSRKELHFFNSQDIWGDDGPGRFNNYDKGIDWYLDQFPPAQKNHIRGEFTISYMSDPTVHKRIKSYFPNVKIIATLRNPVDMVYSLFRYFENGAILNIPDTFETTIKSGIFLDKGFYFKHLSNFFESFPKKNIHIILHDDINKDPTKVVKDLYRFLNVDANFIPPSLNIRVNEAFTVRSKLLKRIGRIFFKYLILLRLRFLSKKIIESRKAQNIYAFINKKPAKYPPIKQEMRSKLYNLYSSDIEQLEKLIGRDLSIWKL